MIGTNTGLRTLLSYRLALDVTANNIANANTPGYSRQRVLLSPVEGVGPSGGFRVGGGAQATSIERITDDFLLSRIRVGRTSTGRLELLTQKLGETESLFRDSDNSGVNQLIGGFFNSLRALTATPSESSARNAVFQSSQDLTAGFGLLSSNLNRIGRDTLGELDTLVGDTNRILSSLHEVNRQIEAQENRGSQAPVLRDQRDQLLNELSSYFDAEVVERSGGRIDLLVGGRLVLGRKGPRFLEVRSADGTPKVYLQGTDSEVSIGDGRFKALLDFSETGNQGIRDDLDRLAYELIFEINRRHSTGVGEDGGFTSLISEFLAQDTNGNGDASDDVLADAELLFPVQEGDLYLTLIDEATGELTRTRISIDPNTTTLQDLATTLNQVDNFSAAADAQGRLTLTAAPGFRFDFSPRVDPSPDKLGTFGGANATLTSGPGFPAFLNAGDSFSISVDGGPAQAVTLQAADFADLNQASAEELAVVLNRDVSGITARVDEGGRLIVQSNLTGSSSSLLITDGVGAPATSLGLSTSLESGANDSVSIDVVGSFSGSENDVYRFEMVGDGIIGETEGLRVKVVNQAGDVVTVLDVGADYEPGDQITVETGLTVSFSRGEVSETSGDSFRLDLLANSDSSDVLAALGLNPFFAGTDASSIRLSNSILDHPERLAASLTGAEGNNGNLFRLLELEENDLETLSGQSFASFYTSIANQLGFDNARAGQDLATQSNILDVLEAERDQVAGVSLEEESLNLIQYQQTFDSMIRYLRAIEETTASVLSLVG